MPLFQAGDVWTGRHCPGALLKDPFVQKVLVAHVPLEKWGLLPQSGGWEDQPAWLAEGLLLTAVAEDKVEQEKLKQP